MRNKKLHRLWLWLVPGLMYGFGELVTGNLFHITILPTILNLVIFYLIYLGLLMIFRTTRYSWPVMNLVLFIFAAAEYFVISFRERPAMIWDVLAIRTAMTVSANYKFTLTPELVVSCLASVGLGVVSWKWPITVGTKKESWKRRIGRVAGWFSGFVVFGVVLFQVLAPKFHLDVPMWDPVVSFEKEGYVLSTILSFKSVSAPKPDGYSKERAEALLREAESGSRNENLVSGNFSDANSLDANSITPVNVICIMNESFSDLRLFNGLTDEMHRFETNEPFLSYYDQLSEAPNTQMGTLYVPVFGAMTANSEYEFLTGNSCAFVPQGSIPYQFYTKPDDDSLARIFGNLGYTTIAMHPYPGYNWNRTEAYENLGFQQFLDLEFYEGLEAEMELKKPRGYMSDQSDYDGILHLLREKDEGEKMFIFNVTMQNHGGFEVDGLESTVHVTELNGENCEGQYPKADQYLTLIQMSDEALEYFLSELEQMDEPTMVVMFGDHQPSVETEFFEALYGMHWTEVPDELKLNSFRTPYLIWTNYDRTVENAGSMSAFMLGSEVLRAAGVEKTGLFAAAEWLREDYDAVHSMGVLKKDGTFLGSQSEDVFNEETPIHDFHMIQYDQIFDK